MKRLATATAILLLIGCGKSGSDSKSKEPNWWCSDSLCARTKAECIARQDPPSECVAKEAALCVMLQDAKLGHFQMCFPTIEKCMKMIEITEIARDIELSRTDPSITPKLRPVSPEEALKRCEDTK